MKQELESIFIDEDYCKTITDAEKAALGYVATYVGSECDWDGDNPNADRSNLKCMVQSALGLGYQCSDTHIGFLKKWFKNDATVLGQLNENCPVVPYGANSQNTFTHINLTVKGDQIIVDYGVNGINMNQGSSWEYTVKDTFKVDGNTIKLENRDESEVKYSNF